MYTEKPYVNLTEASEITGICISTIKNHINKGYLPNFSESKGHYQIDLDDLEQYLIEIDSESRFRKHYPPEMFWNNVHFFLYGILD